MNALQLSRLFSNVIGRSFTPVSILFDLESVSKLPHVIRTFLPHMTFVCTFWEQAPVVKNSLNKLYRYSCMCVDLDP